jgi:alkylmercury lyase
MATTQERTDGVDLSLDELARSISAAMPTLGVIDQQIALATYRLLAAGKPVATEAIAGEVGVPVARVEAALESWPGVYRDDAGNVTGFWGLAIEPLDPEYSLQIDGKTSYAWCALDTLFIPPLMGKTVSVQATDPVNGERVSLVVDGSGVREVTPPGAVVSMVIPNGPFGYDVIESFCHKLLFFASQESGRSWVAEHEGTTLLTVQEAFEVGRFAPKFVYPDVFGQPKKR